jgi:hypothetical protein
MNGLPTDLKIDVHLSPTRSLARHAAQFLAELVAHRTEMTRLLGAIKVANTSAPMLSFLSLHVGREASPKR